MSLFLYCVTPQRGCFLRTFVTGFHAFLPNFFLVAFASLFQSFAFVALLLVNAGLFSSSCGGKISCSGGAINGIWNQTKRFIMIV